MLGESMVELARWSKNDEVATLLDAHSKRQRVCSVRMHLRFAGHSHTRPGRGLFGENLEAACIVAAIGLFGCVLNDWRR